ncbi:MAG: tRNA (N(6)-L-threonylcarbamoyladenosine(37)-C(2))-methylthiotransferase MtaB [Bacteroidota bacterium]
MQKTVAFHTLGCKLNFAETSTLARQFEQNGFSKTDFENGADVFVINTCSVTEDTDRECRRIVRNALRNSPDAFMIVTGCYAQLNPAEIANIKGVDLVVGASEKFNMINFLNGGHKKELSEIHSCEIEEATLFVDAYSSGDRTRAFLKVQDGCDYNCSYCTIPLARGSSRSDSVENVVHNAKKIALQGIKEIVLTGVNIGDFKAEVREQRADVNGHQTSNVRRQTFFDLIKELDKVKGISRFRISSIEPNLLTDEIIEFVAKSEKFVPHFHIPLQSGADRILGLMRRRYKRELYAERVQKIKSLMPYCCIGVDVIVGFPGETEEDFLDTYNFIDSLNVSYLHIFTYSERDNTKAIDFKPVVPIEERRKRNKTMRNLSAAKQQKFYSDNIAAERTVLFERENKDGFIHGFTENYIKVKTKFNSNLINKLREVFLSGIDSNGSMLCEISDMTDVQILHPKSHHSHVS